MILPYAYPTGSPEFMGGGEGGDTAHSFVFCEVFARSLFELYLFANTKNMWSLCSKTIPSLFNEDVEPINVQRHNNDQYL
jgi:hypothetical protein